MVTIIVEKNGESQGHKVNKVKAARMVHLYKQMGYKVICLQGSF